MSTRVFAWMLILVGVAFVYASGFLAGAQHSNQACMAKAQKAAKEELQAAYSAQQAEMLRSQKAAQEVATHVDALHTSYRTLEEKYHVLKTRTPTPLLSRPGPACPVSLATAREGAQNAGVDDRLSLGAVWLWNRALDPTHAAVPDAACNAFDPADKTCAADAGITLWDAWENHLTNAESCAQDRLRLQGLIDYLQSTRTPGATHAD